jgi:enoyl-CoA hydratase/carnithine racemase
MSRQSCGVPGGGIHSLWPEVIGSVRGRTFVLTQQVIGAEEANTLGVISEFVSRDRLLVRELAARISSVKLDLEDSEVSMQEHSVSLCRCVGAGQSVMQKRHPA